MTAPRTYYETEVLQRLKLQGYELTTLLDLGLLAPVGRDARRAPIYCASTIDNLATPAQLNRIRDAIWWDFKPHPELKGLDGRPGSLLVDEPHYPFDSEEQYRRARRIYQTRKRCAPFPYPNPGELERFRKRAEERATKAFERAHGIRGPRRKHSITFRRRKIRITRGEILRLVWSKTMIRAADELDMSERTLREQCKRLLIPMPTRGHFNHKDPKDRPPRPRLPPLPAVRSRNRCTNGLTAISEARDSSQQFLEHCACASFIEDRRSQEPDMPKENDLEGAQDMGGKHGGQAGMPKPENRSAAQQGIVRDQRGQEQPADKDRAQSGSPAKNATR